MNNCPSRKRKINRCNYYRLTISLPSLSVDNSTVCSNSGSSTVCNSSIILSTKSHGYDINLCHILIYVLFGHAFPNGDHDLTASQHRHRLVAFFVCLHRHVIVCGEPYNFDRVFCKTGTPTFTANTVYHEEAQNESVHAFTLVSVHWADVTVADSFGAFRTRCVKNVFILYAACCYD